MNIQSDREKLFPYPCKHHQYRVKSLRNKLLLSLNCSLATGTQAFPEANRTNSGMFPDSISFWNEPTSKIQYVFHGLAWGSDIVDSSNALSHTELWKHLWGALFVPHVAQLISKDWFWIQVSKKDGWTKPIFSSADTQKGSKRY